MTSGPLSRWWQALEKVPDPEIPVLSVVDLGVVREIRESAPGEVAVDITPTYSGCPAMKLIEDEIERALTNAGATSVLVSTVFQPAWTTDWISQDARERLRAYGIAPPSGRAAASDELIPLRRRADPVGCPYCGSLRTETRSQFGSTPCKALLFCAECRQPFEYMKPL